MFMLNRLIKIEAHQLINSSIPGSKQKESKLIEITTNVKARIIPSSQIANFDHDPTIAGKIDTSTELLYTKFHPIPKNSIITDLNTGEKWNTKGKQVCADGIGKLFVIEIIGDMNG